MRALGDACRCGASIESNAPAAGEEVAVADSVHHPQTYHVAKGYKTSHKGTCLLVGVHA